MSYGTRLRELMENKNSGDKIKQAAIAQKLDCQSSTISSYKDDSIKPSYEVFIKICKLFNKDANYFMQDDLGDIAKPQISPDEESLILKYRELSQYGKDIINHMLEVKEDKYIQEPEQINIYHLPVYEQEAAAGVGRLGDSNDYNIEDFIVNDDIPQEATFAIRIAGDSMLSKSTDNLIHTGSIVLIDPKLSKYTLKNKIVIVSFEGEVICKRYIDKGDYILFQSDNEEYKSENRISYDNSEYKIIGIVLGVIENSKFVKMNYLEKKSSPINKVR